MPFDIDSETLTDDERSRLTLLHSVQKSYYGMDPRRDSILSYRFAKGTVPKHLRDVNSVAHELFITDRIYNQTRYGSLIQDVMRGVAAWVKSEFDLEWKDVWYVVRLYVPNALKFYCVNEYQFNLSQCAHHSAARASSIECGTQEFEVI